MPSYLRPLRIPTLAVLSCLALAALAAGQGAATASVVPRATRSCNPPDYPGAKGGYFNEIRATAITCTYAKKFVVSYWRCRTRSGRSPSGHCTTHVNKFSCKEGTRKYAGAGNSKAIFYATVTCRRGGTQRIVHTYQEGDI
jgi:hypothetical protein